VAVLSGSQEVEFLPEFDAFEVLEDITESGHSSPLNWNIFNAIIQNPV